MREIKFRAWNYDYGMLYFNLDTFQKDYHDQYGNIMQFTGLTDKNGKDVYEGDIIRIRWIEMTYTTHTGDNIIWGSYTDPDIVKIYQEDYLVVFKDGIFSISTEDVEPPVHFHEPYNPVDAFLYPWWEDQGDIEYHDMSDDYFEDEGFETLDDLKKTLGCEIIGNIYENHELLNQTS